MFCVAAVGGTGLSIYIGKPLVRLNFQQEAQEANFRWGTARQEAREGTGQNRVWTGVGTWLLPPVHIVPCQYG